MKYTDGKSREENAKESLAALLNDNSNNPFGVKTEQEFKRKLLHMSLEDKGLLCNKVGVHPVANGHVHIMDQRLMEAFRSHMEAQPIFLDDKASKKTKKVDYLNPPQSLRKLL